jgi:hypothetical protein
MSSPALGRFLPSALGKVSTVVLTGAMACAALAFAADRVAKEPVSGDVHVFWQAGYDYLHGNNLYETRPGLRSFIYPPFAALFFVPLGALPFKVAAFLFFVGNYLLWYFTFVWIVKALRLFEDSTSMPWVIGLTFFATFKLFLNNLTTIQVNNYVFLPALVAVYCFLKGRATAAIALAGLATSIKLTPVLLFFWMLVRRPTPRFLGSCLLAGAMFLAVPAVLRGPSQGVNDVRDYYKTFLSVFVGGGVNVNNSNQNLVGTILRYCTDVSGPGGDNDGHTFHVVDCDPSSVRVAGRLLSIALLVGVVLSSIAQARAGVPPNLYEASAYLLMGHLVAGCTWKAHLVTLALPLAVIASDIFSGRKQSLWLKLLFGYFCVLGMLGKEIVGKQAILFINAYGFYTIGMVLIVLTFLMLPLQKRDGAAPSAPAS